MIEKLLPPEAECAEEFGDPAEPALFPEEAALVAAAVGKRRREFGSARGCARRALGRLGVPPAPILSGERGAPRWPAGIVGSITHCAGYRAAAVARSRDVAALGIDAEPAGALPAGVLEYVSRPAERAMLRDLSAADPGVAWDRLLFCAKESVYKAWFPLTRRWLGFEDAEVTICAADGTFDARVLLPGAAQGPASPGGFRGRWLTGEGLIVTAVAVPAAETPEPAAETPAPGASP